MSLPTAVKKAGDRADALQEGLNKEKPQENKEGTTPVDGTPAIDNRDTSLDSQTPEVKTPETPPSKDNDADFQQKYQTLKGKFDAEMPRMHQDLRDLKQTVSDLQFKNSELMSAANNQTPKESTVEGLDPKDFAEYGEEFEGLVKTIQTLQNQNAELKGQVEQVSGNVKQQADNDYTVYMDQIKKTLSTELKVDFDQLNNDPAFLNFLRQYPANGQESRHAQLQRAEASRNLPATIDIFKEYLGNINPAKQPDPVIQPNIQPTSQPPGTDVNPPAQQSTTMWNRAEISAFYQDVSSGKFKGREDEQKAYEQDIYLAQKQGRIVA